MQFKIHDLSHLTPEQAYDETQTNDAIKDRDVINMGNGNVAIMVKAWPVVACGDIADFPVMCEGWEVHDGGRYEESHMAAMEIAV